MRVVNQVKDLIGIAPEPAMQSPSTPRKRVAELVGDGAEHATAMPEDLIGALGVIACSFDRDTIPFAEKVAAIAQKTIEMQVADVAMVTVHEDLRFSLQFFALDTDRATLKLGQVSEVLAARLQTALGDTIEITVDFIAGQRQFRGQHKPVEEQIEDLFEKLEEKRQNDIADWEGTVRAVRKDAAALFFPIWNVRNEVTDISRCELDLALRSQSMKAFLAAANQTEVRGTELDLNLMALKKGLLGIHAAKRARAAPKIMVPVEASILLNPESRDVYLRQLAEIPEAYAALLIVELLPTEDTPKPAIPSLCQMVATHIKKVALRVSDDRDLLRVAAQAQVWGYCADMSKHRMGDTARFAWLSGLVRLSRRLNREVVGLNVQTVGVANTAISLGVYRLSGPVVHMSVNQPRPATRIRPFPRAK